MYLRTSAFIITKESYSLAAAILPPVFSTIPMKDVLDHYVVIHQPSVEFTHEGNVQTLTLGCSWMSKEDFFEMYTLKKFPVKIEIVEVEVIS